MVAMAATEAATEVAATAAGGVVGAEADRARQRLVDRSDPAHVLAIEELSNYLTVMNLLFRSISQVLADQCGLTTLQYRMLLRLLGSPQHAMHSTDLAAILHVGLSTVSAAVPKLVEEGLVSREEDPDDMRVVSLRLNEAGLSAIEQADLCVGEFLQRYWKNLTAEQLEAALASSVDAVVLHDAKRLENGRFRLDTAFFDTIMLSRTLTAARLGELGFKTNEVRILVAMRILEPRTTASRIASYLFLRNSDVTAPLKALEAKGLISKERSDENRRVKVLSLTAKGRAKVEELLPLTHDALLETCRSDERAVRIHLSAACDVVERERGAALFG